MKLRLTSPSFSLQACDEGSRLSALLALASKPPHTRMHSDIS